MIHWDVVAIVLAAPVALWGIGWVCTRDIHFGPIEGIVVRFFTGLFSIGLVALVAVALMAGYSELSKYLHPPQPAERVEQR